MNHEPECNLNLKDEHGRPRFPEFTMYLPSFCNCEAIRAAYERGRNDAAETVRIAAYELLMQNGVKGITWGQMLDVAIAAARGGDK